MWTDSDYELLAGWLIEQEERCPRCGTRRDDWMDSEGHPLEVPHFHADLDECLGCTALGRQTDQARKKGDGRPGDRPTLRVNPEWEGVSWG